MGMSHSKDFNSVDYTRSYKYRKNKKRRRGSWVSFYVKITYDIKILQVQYATSIWSGAGTQTL